MLPPARPPFFFASDGLVGLGCEGNGWVSPQRRSLGPSRFRVVFPAGGRKVGASSVQWNKVLWPSLRLVVNRSGAGDGLVRLGFVGFVDQVGAPDLGESCTGVCLLSSLVLLVLFLMFLEACVAFSGLGWFTLFGVVEVWEGVSRSKSPTAEVLSMRISCSFSYAWSPFFDLAWSVWWFVSATRNLETWMEEMPVRSEEEDAQ